MVQPGLPPPPEPRRNRPGTAPMHGTL